MMYLNHPIFSALKAVEGTVLPYSGVELIKGTQELFLGGQEPYLPFGRMVCRSLNKPNIIVLPSPDNQRVIGVSAFSERHLTTVFRDAIVHGVEPLQAVPVLAKGLIYLRTETEISERAKLFIRFQDNDTPNKHEAVGRIRTGNDNQNAFELTPGTYAVRGSVYEGNLVPVEFDFSPLL